MADYSAKISLIVEGQQKVTALQKQVTDLSKQLKELSRLDISGVFEEELLGTAVSKLRTEKDKLVASTKNNISAQKGLNKSTERQLLNQIKLNSAVDLYERKLRQVERSNAATQQQFAGRIEEIGKAFDFFKGKQSVTGVRAVATELGRIVEYENEILLTEKQREANARKSRKYARELNELELQGVNTQKARAKFDKFAAVADTNKIKQAAIYRDALEDQLQILRAQVKETTRISKLAPSSPVLGGASFPGSPKFLAAQRKSQTERLSGVALGAGFPLLFGGGPGAVLGGAAGGLVGGPAGFAAQIALSAIGQQIDTFVAEVAKTGVALTSASGTFELVKEKSLFSSEEVKKLAYALEEQGKVQELATLLTTDLAKQIGSQGVTALQEAGTETKEFTRLVNLLFTQLGAFVAGPLSDFLRFINKALGSVTTNVQFRSFEASLQGNQAKRFAEIVAEERGGKTKNVRGGGRTQFVPGTLTTDVQRRALARAEKEGIAPKVTGLTTFEDTQTIRPPKGRTGKSAGEREAERVAKALIQQRAVTLEIQRQSEFSEKIAAAELAKDPVLARRIQEQQELAELGVQTAKELELEKDTSVQLAIARTAQAKADLIRKKAAQDIAKTEQQRQEKFADTLAGLEYQIEYENAVTREKRNQLELDAKARKLKKDGFTPKEIDTLIGLEKSIQKQQEPLAKFIRDSEKELKDLQQVAVNVSQGIGNAIANSMSQGIVGLIEGTKNAQQVFADFLKSVGDILIQEGTRMIAMYIAIAIAKAFAGLGGKGGETNTQFMERTGNLDLVGDSYKGLQGFATGGFVTSPTSAVVGEGGEPEYIIPASKMRGAMSRYAAGARGSSVIPGSGEQAAGGMGGDTANAAPIDVRYTVERINSVDYVTADQFRAGMAQAAQQGATQGERRALRTLQNSAATRGRIGV